VAIIEVYGIRDYFTYCCNVNQVASRLAFSRIGFILGHSEHTLMTIANLLMGH